MPRHQNVSVSGSWVQLTNADVSVITFQVKSRAVDLAVTAGATAPAAGTPVLTYRPGQGEVGINLSDLSPGIAGTRVWARSHEGTATVAVSHA